MTAIRDDRSLCGKWLALGGPMWDRNQETTKTPGRADCRGCWQKRTKEIANG